MRSIILMEDEPVFDVLCKWGLWLLIIIVFILITIYHSDCLFKEKIITNFNNSDKF